MNLDPRTGGWRPIATAPRDGTTIWVMHEDVGAFAMRWGDKTSNPFFSGETGMWEAPGEFTWSENSHYEDDCGPSHWKPFGD